MHMVLHRSRKFLPLVLLAITTAILFHSHDALAQVNISGNSTGTVSVGVGGGALFSSGTNFLNALQTLLTSTWARLVAIIAVFAVGLSFMFGRLSMQVAFSVIGGIILVFGAPAIVDSISSSL
jgi:type IV secretory pathway VirB2 component (pilin)